MEYPEEIYATRDGGLLTSKQCRDAGSGWGRRHAYRLGYEAGKTEQADPLTGYSNLTEAISAGEPIDYEKLDGLKVQCANPDVGTLHGALNRNCRFRGKRPEAWWGEEMGGPYISALNNAWYNMNGWTLWVEGEIPLAPQDRRPAAVGHVLRG